MDKLTYEQRVNIAAKTYVDSFYSYDVDARLSDFQYEGRKAVAAQAEAIREALGGFLGPSHLTINSYLIENGYVPAPEVKEVDPVISHYAKEAEKRSIPRNEKTILQLIKEGSLCGCGGAYRIMNCVSFCTRCGKERI